MAPPPVKGVVFDVMGTMVDMSPVSKRFVAKGLSTDAAKAYNERMNFEGVSLSRTECYASMKEIGMYNLRRTLQAANMPDVEATAEYIFGGYDEIRPWPDTEAGLRFLKAKGVKVATLTNYTVSFSQGALGHAGLDALVDTPLDIGAVQRWKPHPATYKFAAKQLGLELEEVMFIAAHLDDTHGAKAAGLRTLYVDRSKEPHPPYFSAPDHTIDSLADLGSVPVW